MKKLSDCHVLIVDDTQANLDILVEGLKPDHKLSLAFNGEWALQIAARTRKTSGGFVMPANRLLTRFPA